MASERDIQDVINTLIAEGVGEGEEGMRLIAETILNRAEERGISPAEVVRQRAQYTGFSNPGAGARRAQNDPAAISAAQAAWDMAQGPDDPTGGANHYFNPNIVTPSWAGSMRPTGQYGNHAFYSDRPVPPRMAPAPVTASPDMAMMRRGTAPTQLIAESFNRLPTPRAPQIRNAGDSLAMSPVLGGRQSIPMMDAAYDTRTGAMQLTAQPVQGSQFGASRAPAPIPAQQSPQISTRRATDPVLQTALNARYPARLPAIPHSTIGQTPSTRSVQTVAVQPTQARPSVSASDLARGRSGISAVATIPTITARTTPQPVATGQPAQTQMQRMAAIYSGGGPTRPASLPSPSQIAAATPFGNSVPARLAPPSPFSPANFGSISPSRVAQIGVDLSGAPTPLPIRTAAITQPARIAPVPRPPYRAVATATATTPPPPLPRPRPSMSPVMPPMPIARPGIGGPAPQGFNLAAMMKPVYGVRKGADAMGRGLTKGAMKALTSMLSAPSGGTAQSISTMEGGSNFNNFAGRERR